MRNDVKPVRPDRDPDKPAKPGYEVAHDAPGTPGRIRERGDATDPAGPKPSSRIGSNTLAGAVTDRSGTTGPVSRSSARTTTTTGKLRDPELERSAREGEAPDVQVLDQPGYTANLPLFVASILAVILIVGLIVWLSWPAAAPADDAAHPPRVGDVLRQDRNADD